MKKITLIMTILLLLTTHQSFAENVLGRPLIVLATPQGSDDPYYGEFFNEIVDFQVSYAKRIAGNDNVIIIAPEGEAYDRVSRALPGHVLKGSISDIWMRDIGASRQKDPILFQYWPEYIQPSSLRTEIRKSFLNVLSQYGISAEDFIPSNIILDGGNFVDNGVDTVVMTTRVYADNPQLSPDEIKNQLMKDSGWNNIAIIDELEGDTTGHADGMVSFIDTNVLALSDLGDKAMNAKYKNSLQTQLGSEVNVIVVPSTYNPKKWRGFTSACGAHVNSLVNDKYIYMPLFFDDPENTKIDKDIFSLFKDNTKKTIVPITVPHVICRMGGNLRCLSWQVKGEVADKLVAAAAADYDSMFK